MIEGTQVFVKAKELIKVAKLVLSPGYVNKILEVIKIRRRKV